MVLVIDTIIRWNSEGKIDLVIKGHSDTVSCLCILNDQLISGSYDNTIKIWDVNGNCKITLEGHTN